MSASEDPVAWGKVQFPNPAAAWFGLVSAAGWADEPPSKTARRNHRGHEANRAGHQRCGAAVPDLDHRCQVTESDRPRVQADPGVKLDGGGGLILLGVGVWIVHGPIPSSPFAQMFDIAADHPGAGQGANVQG
jgi:hypothetical protein